MAIALDATSSISDAGFTNVGAGPAVWSHTCAAGAYLTVMIETGNGDFVSGVTYNGVAMTQGVKRAMTVGEAYVYYLANPSSGANDISVSLSSSESAFMGMGTSFTGVNQGAPEATGTGSSTSTGLVSVTTVTDNDWLVGIFVTEAGSALTVGANTTQRKGNTGTAISVDTNAAQTPAGAKTMTATNGSGLIISAAITLQPAGAVASSTSSGSLLTMGVGN